MSNFRNIVVIGTSAGGLRALTTTLAGWPRSFDLVVLAVMHLSRNSQPQIVIKAVQKQTFLQCSLARNGEPLEKGNFYLAPADSHLTVKENRINLTQGPHENKYRPRAERPEH